MKQRFNLGNGLYYTTPHIPRDEKEILYHELPKEQQYWRSPHCRVDPLYIYSAAELKKMKEKQRIDFISMWRRRWEEGFWFFNNGEPVYLNTMLVDHLVFNKFGGRYFTYNESQRDDFYFRELIWHMDEVDGTQWIKPRRYGMTMEEITECITVLISGEGHNIALQSANKKIATETLLLPLIETYISRPHWMREQFRMVNRRIPRNTLELVNDILMDNDNFLGGKVNVYPSNAKALEGKEFMYVVQDEFSKNEPGANPRQIMEVNRKTIRNAGRRGKMSCLSTTGDSDDVMESIKEWITLAAESKYNPITKSSQSGLIKRFVSAAWSQYLPPSLLPDKYGKIDLARNEEWVWSEINKKKPGTKEYYYELRKMCLTEEHALMSATDASYFDKIKLTARRQQLEELLIDEKPYVKGKLEEYQQGIVKMVKFVPDPTGPWMVRHLPFVDKKRRIDNANRFTVSPDNVYFPPKNPEGVVMYDPIRFRKGMTKSNHLSRAAIGVKKKFDYFNKPDSPDYFGDCRFEALYVGRPDKPELADYEAMKACKFWGYPIVIERNVPGSIEEFDKNNMLPFVMKDPKDGIYGIWTSQQVKEEGLKMLVSRYSAPQHSGQIDYIEDNPFEMSLLDLENFDIQNSTAFDVAMCELIGEFGLLWLKEETVVESEVQAIMAAINASVPARG